jgi:hypothetical protein
MGSEEVNAFLTHQTLAALLFLHRERLVRDLERTGEVRARAKGGWRWG